jgi:hypothetical protein
VPNGEADKIGTPAVLFFAVGNSVYREARQARFFIEVIYRAHMAG